MYFNVTRRLNGLLLVDVDRGMVARNRPECRDFPRDSVHICIVQATDAADAIGKSSGRHPSHRA